MSEKTETKLFVATKAFIVYRNKILLLKESSKYEDGSNVGRYDVPGGRIKPGQRSDKSLLREIKEETGLTVKIRKPFFVNEWRPVVDDEHWQIVGTFFECYAKTNKVKLSQDHEEYVWINPKDFRKYKIIGNLVGAFKAHLKETRK